MKSIIISIIVGVLAIAGGVFTHSLLDKQVAVDTSAAMTADVYDAAVGSQTPVLSWAATASPVVKAVLEDAYGAFFANYTTPPPVKPYLGAVPCSAQILEDGFKNFSADDQMALTRAYDALYHTNATPAELFVPTAKPGTITPAIAVVVQEYFAVRVREETTPELQSEVLERLLAAAHNKVEVTTFSKKDCAGVPVAAKYQ